MHFCILGSHPNISLAEIQAIIPDIANLQINEQMVIFNCPDWDAEKYMNLLGGTIKLGEIILQSKLDNLDPQSVVNMIVKSGPKENSRALDFGWTVYASKGIQKKLFKFPVQIKKELKRLGYSTRWVTGKGGQPLSPAAIAKCKLCNEPNADLCVLVNNNEVFIGKTSQVQDADFWSLRDFGRPFRDSLNGMLPPKLARIMVNLAHISGNGIILDPFCGSGTILMEAALATKTKTIIGGDIEERQIYASQKNIDWLLQKRILRPDDEPRFKLILSDVKLLAKHIKPKSIDAIISEGWLGPPLRGDELETVLNKNAANVTNLWVDTLIALKPLLKRSATLVITSPRYRTRHARAAVDLTSHLANIGYQLSAISHQLPADLIYSRSNQFVERKILILQPN